MMLAKIFRALADQSRLRTLGVLQGQELCVCQIVEFLRLAPSTVSKHMSVLLGAGLVTSSKRGKWVYYRLSHDDSHVAQVQSFLEGLLPEDDTVQRDRRTVDKILAIDPEQLCRLQAAGKGVHNE